MKSFDELYNLDITPYLKKIEGSEFDHLPWVDCHRILRENGMTPEFFCREVYWSPDGKTALVNVLVKIGGEMRSITHPVPFYEPTAVQIANTTPRAFVKCVALNWGLGLKLWEREGADSAVPVDAESVKKKAREMTMLFSEKVQAKGSPQAVHELLGTTQKLMADIVENGTIEEVNMMIKRLERI